MTSNFLITRPKYDIVVTYLSKWSKEVLDFAKNKIIQYVRFFF